MKWMVNAIFITTAMLMLLAGCTTSRQLNPVIEETSGGILVRRGVGVIATTADRRVVVINKQTEQFCAEPSPDVAEAIINTLTASVDSTISGSSEPRAIEAALSAKVDVAKNLRIAPNQLLQRTQGIQYVRDALFSLCVQRVNGWMQNETTINYFKDILTGGKSLIEQELTSREKMMPYLVELEKLSIERLRLQQEKCPPQCPPEAPKTKTPAPAVEKKADVGANGIPLQPKVVAEKSNSL